MEMMETSKGHLDDLIQLVSFRLGQEEFGIDILKVQEINRMVEITKVPQAPHYCEGVINLLVCDVNGNVVGVIVDAVEEVLRVQSSTIEPPPEIITSAACDYIKGVAKMEKRLLMTVEEVMA
jgi:purine-binding chemotaxis protein CheW